MKSKNGLVAIVLSLLLPGTGHLYAGATLVGVLLIALTVAIDLSVRWVASSVTILQAMPFIVMGWRILVALLALAAARKASPGPKSILASPVVLIILIVGINFFSFTMVQEPIGRMEEVEMNNNSMSPNIFIREKLAIDKGAEPRLGAIAAVSYPRPYRAQTLDIDRIVGMPGETFALRNNLVYIDGEMREPTGTENLEFQINLITERGDVDMEFWPQYDLKGAGKVDTGYIVMTNEALAAKMASENEWISNWYRRRPAIGTTSELLFFEAIAGWNESDMGPFTIPKAGLTISLDSLNRNVYRRAMLLENNGIEWRDSVVLQNDEPITEYTFVEDHYFLLSDSRDNGADSRVWGFVARPFILGEARYITESYNEERSYTMIAPK